MSKIVWNALRLSPLLLSATLLLANRTQASSVLGAELAPSRVAAAGQTTTSPKPALSNVQLAQNAPSSDSSSAEIVDVTPVAEIAEQDTTTTDAFAQVTSVSQLSDVQPTDWAFQALQSLVERYGCIAGYPDSTYRGNRALTRYEFAAGVNACLDRVNELIAAATSDLVTREDLATLQRLQEEFSAEIATLRGRVDSLEAQTAELEANQFSTTTKLTGEVIAAVADVFGDNRAVRTGEDEGSRGDEDVNTILADRARLNFDTSFTGRDLLRTRLQARNIVQFSRTTNPGAAGDTGTAMTRLGFDGDQSNDVEIDDFYYRFPVSNLANVQVDFARAEFNDNVFTFNPSFDSSGRGAISRFGRFNPIYRLASEGAGLTLNLLPEAPIGVSLSYLTPRGNDPNQGFGIFNGEYAALGQVILRPSESLNIGLVYAHSYDTSQTSPINDNETNPISISGGTGSNYANNPFDGSATSSDHYAVQASFQATPNVTVAGWAGLTYATAENGDNVDQVTTGDNARMFNWAATLALTDLVKEGSVLGVIFGQPPKITNNDFGVGADRTDDGNSYHLEGLYRFPITDNIEVTPGVIVIFNPEHNNDNDNIYVGTIRTTFRF